MFSSVVRFGAGGTNCEYCVCPFRWSLTKQCWDLVTKVEMQQSFTHLILSNQPVHSLLLHCENVIKIYNSSNGWNTIHSLHLIYLGFLGGQAQDRWEESYQFNVIFISLNCLQSKWVHGWQREIIVLPPLTNYMYTLSTLYTVKTNTYIHILPFILLIQ